jgi:hypothetical protein
MLWRYKKSQLGTSSRLVIGSFFVFRFKRGDLHMSKRTVFGSATERWHRRMLFGGRHAGREPDNFSRLPDIGRYVLERRTLILARWNHDLRNWSDLATIPYHKTRKGLRTKGMVNSGQTPYRCGGSNSLTLECAGEPSSLSTSDISSNLVWIWDRSPVSSSRLEVTWEGGADPGRLIQVTQSVCPLPHPP